MALFLYFFVCFDDYGTVSQQLSFSWKIKFHLGTKDCVNEHLMSDLFFQAENRNCLLPLDPALMAIWGNEINGLGNWRNKFMHR